MEREENESADHKPDRMSPDQPVDTAGTPPVGTVRCPQCGGNRIRRPTKPLLVNVVACAVAFVLTPVACAMVIGVVVSLLALPFTTCIAVVGNSRCQDCRHRFKPGVLSIDRPKSARFPWVFHVVNAILLFLLCVVGPNIMRAMAGAGKLPEMTADMGRIITWGLFLWVSLAYHLVVYAVLKRRVTAPVLWAILFLLPGVALGGLVFYTSRPSLRMQGFLAYARLAPLPQSATGVRFCSWSSPFSGEDFIRFTADPNDIERFLAESPALQGQEPERFSATRMRLEHPRDDQGNLIYRQDGQHEYFIPSSSAPPWYKQEIRGPARKYPLQPPRYQYPGEVLVDDETNTVYIYASFS